MLLNNGQIGHLDPYFLELMDQIKVGNHPGVDLRANLESISHRCHLFGVEFVWELTKETIHLPLGCLQGGKAFVTASFRVQVRDSRFSP